MDCLNFFHCFQFQKWTGCRHRNHPHTCRWGKYTLFLYFIYRISFPQGKYFYITPGICPSLATMKAIVECAGGKVLAKQPSFRKLMEHKQNKVSMSLTWYFFFKFSVKIYIYISALADCNFFLFRVYQKLFWYLVKMTFTYVENTLPEA